MHFLLSLNSKYKIVKDFLKDLTDFKTVFWLIFRTDFLEDFLTDFLKNFLTYLVWEIFWTVFWADILKHFLTEFFDIFFGQIFWKIFSRFFDIFLDRFSIPSTKIVPLFSEKYGFSFCFLLHKKYEVCIHICTKFLWACSKRKYCHYKICSALNYSKDPNMVLVF